MPSFTTSVSPLMRVVSSPGLVVSNLHKDHHPRRMRTGFARKKEATRADRDSAATSLIPLACLHVSWLDLRY